MVKPLWTTVFYLNRILIFVLWILLFHVYIPNGWAMWPMSLRGFCCQEKKALRATKYAILPFCIGIS